MTLANLSTSRHFSAGTTFDQATRPNRQRWEVAAACSPLPPRNAAAEPARHAHPGAGSLILAARPAPHGQRVTGILPMRKIVRNSCRDQAMRFRLRAIRSENDFMRMHLQRNRRLIFNRDAKTSTDCEWPSGIMCSFGAPEPRKYASPLDHRFRLSLPQCRCQG